MPTDARALAERILELVADHEHSPFDTTVDLTELLEQYAAEVRRERVAAEEPASVRPVADLLGRILGAHPADGVQLIEQDRAAVREAALREAVERVNVARRMHPSAAEALDFVAEFLAWKKPGEKTDG